MKGSVQSCQTKGLPIASALHFLLLSWHGFVWIWHWTSPIARKLPGASGFGWFFRCGRPRRSGFLPCGASTSLVLLTHILSARADLTFFSYTLQFVQLTTCCLAVLIPVRLGLQARQGDHSAIASSGHTGELVGCADGACDLAVGRKLSVTLLCGGGAAPCKRLRLKAYKTAIGRSCCLTAP